MGNSFDVSWPVMRASIAATSATAQGEGSGGQDKALRRLWVSQAGVGRKVRALNKTLLVPNDRGES